MKPRVAKGWACGRCNTIYPHNQPGKELAGSCCSCRKCGGPSTYTGHGSSCRRCAAEAMLLSAEEAAKQAELSLKLARRAAAGPGNGVSEEKP